LAYEGQLPKIHQATNNIINLCKYIWVDKRQEDEEKEKPMEDVKEQEEEMEDEEGSDVDEKKPTVIPQRISISLSDLGCTSLYITDEGKTVRLNSSDNKYYNVLSLNPLDKVGLYYWEVLI